MRIVFIVTAYRLPDQLSRLVKRLAVRGHSVLIHIDKKVKQSDFAEMLGDSTGKGSVRFLPSRQTCYWSGSGVLKASIDGLRMAVRLNTDCDFVFLMTGQCYPLMSMAGIEAKLRGIGEQSIISSHPMPIPWWPNGGMDHLQNWHRHIGSRLVISPAPGSSWKRKLVNLVFRRRPLPRRLQPFYGGAYWVMHRSAVEFVLKFIRSRPDVVNYYNYSFIPDEMFFNTIIGNSGLPFINDLPYYVRFQPNNDGHPDILTAADHLTLLQSDKMFARKFDQSIDESILALLDAQAVEQ